jgi:hypothetical protein
MPLELRIFEIDHFSRSAKLPIQAVHSKQRCNYFLDHKIITVLFIAGKHACEGKVGHKFDMEPHKENLSDYAKLCRERTTKSMIKTRKVQVRFLI